MCPRVRGHTREPVGSGFSPRLFTSAQVAVIYSSSDGINWTPDSYPNIALFMDVDVFRLAFGNGKFLATTVRGQILTNP